MPKLSVILPARNAATTVAQAVSSTLRALPDDAELVVLDDGSTDTTAAAALRAGERFQGPNSRLKVVSRPASGGIAHALNWLIDNTDSEYIARMDADDLSAPWRFRTALPALQRGNDVVFQQVAFLSGKVVKPQPPLGIPSEVFPLYLLLTNPVSHPTMVATRAALSKVGGYRHVPAEDYDLWIRCAVAGLHLQRQPLWGLAYRVHPAQITASHQWRTASWTNPEQAAAYAQLATRVVGAPTERLVSAALLPVDKRAAALERAERYLGKTISTMPQPHRMLLQRKLRTKLSWARQFASPTDADFSQPMTEGTP
ncbi:glycosyltransferase family 2 protein [Corynebacterium hindlerae]|uniref:glycosyltransferase family 2 protein n=1 Tax=Corynebacterium hindlerae TaxID=699041 RepID=UPI003AAE2F54